MADKWEFVMYNGGHPQYHAQMCNVAIRGASLKIILDRFAPEDRAKAIDIPLNTITAVKSEGTGKSPLSITFSSQSGPVTIQLDTKDRDAITAAIGTPSKARASAQPKEVIATKSETPPPKKKPKKLFCSACGDEIDAEATFCPSCGAKFA